ncbi:hypothetical protein EIP91_010596 [Steccherinum ochraceum]|uniref:Uncharacterized protein n=1 Tax=Steccherinum ochraceum TaxID=92696 RepID=A0A4R0R0F6_9APHY|nr:hypothetical protein EIP91_010596 [Steccherinum ochraceum]
MSNPAAPTRSSFGDLSKLKIDMAIVEKRLIKGINVGGFPPIPNFTNPSWGSTTPPLREAVSRSPVYLEDSYFYVAWMPHVPFPSGELMTECFCIRSEDMVPVDRDVTSDTTMFVLEASFLTRWESFEEMIERTINIIQAYVFPPPKPTPLRLHAKDYGYRNAYPTAQQMRHAAWKSRAIFSGMLSYLAFLVAYCRQHGIMEPKRKLLEATNTQWYNWVITSREVTSKETMFRKGGFVYALKTTPSLRCKGFLSTCVSAGLPLWFDYGQAGTAFHLLIPLSDMHRDINLTHPQYELAKLHASNAPSTSTTPTSTEPTTPDPSPSASAGPSQSSDGRRRPVQTRIHPVQDVVTGQTSRQTMEEFFQRRQEANANTLKSESPKRRQARLQRVQTFDGPGGQRMPGPKSNARIFVWEKDLEDPTIRTRTIVTKGNWEREWANRRGQRRYDAFRNEWDICSDFGEDSNRFDTEEEENELYGITLDANGYPNVPPAPKEPAEVPMDVDEDPVHPPSHPTPSLASKPPVRTPSVPHPPPPAVIPAATPPPASPASPVPTLSPPQSNPNPTPGPSTLAPAPAAAGPPPLNNSDALTALIAPVPPVESREWQNPSSFASILQFHYGLHADDPVPTITLDGPKPNIRRVLGWLANDDPELDDLALSLLSKPSIPMLGVERLKDGATCRIQRRRYQTDGVRDALPLPNNDCYVFTDMPGNKYPWTLVLHSSTVVMFVLRVGRTESTETVVAQLVAQGMPFSLYRRRESFSTPRGRNVHHQAIATRNVRLGYIPMENTEGGRTYTQPGAKQFRWYMARLREFFAVKSRLRAAIQHGGLVWRIACEFIDVEDDISCDGPGEDSLVHGGQPVHWYERAPNQPTGVWPQQMWRDVLSEVEVDFICGVYLDDSNDQPKSLPKHISWWPRPNIFQDSGFYTGYWTPFCEQWYQKRFASLADGSDHPRSPPAFRSSMKYARKPLGKLHHNQLLVSSILLGRIAPPPPQLPPEKVQLHHAD